MKTRLLSEAFDAIIMSGTMPGSGARKNLTHGSRKTAPAWSAHSLYVLEQRRTRRWTFVPAGKQVPYLVKPFEVAELISQARKLLLKAQAASAGTD